MANDPRIPTKEFLESIGLQHKERYLPSSLDESHTILEKLNRMGYDVNQSNELSKQVISRWNEFLKWFDNDFDESVIEKISAELTDEKIVRLTQPKIYELVDDQLTDVNKKIGNLNSFRSELDIISKLKESLNEIAVSSALFGGKSDGVTDDSKAVTDAFNYALTNKKNLYIPPNTYLAKPVILDSLNKRINIDAPHLICETSGLTIKNNNHSRINVCLIGGGDGTEFSFGVTLADVLGAEVKIFADNYKGTVLRCGMYDLTTNTPKRARDCLVTLITRYCYRALLHGSPNENFNQGMFGTYNLINDRQSDRGSLFYNSTDIGIAHYENAYAGPGNSVYFKDCYGHIQTLAIGGGGNCQYLLYLEGKNSGAQTGNRLEIDILFSNGENPSINHVYVGKGGSLNVGLLNVISGDIGVTLKEDTFQVAIDRITTNGRQPTHLIKNNEKFYGDDWTKGSVMQFSNYHRYLGGTIKDLYIGQDAESIKIGGSPLQRVGFFGNNGIARMGIRELQTTANQTDTINKLNELITKLSQYGLLEKVT